MPSTCQGGPKLSHLFFADDLILFGEASLTQVQLIQETMDIFCKEAGQTISAEKSLIYFSSNVPDQLQEELALISGFCHSTSFGSYLGVPILSGRLPKGFYKGIIEKMRGKLASWKMKTLSLAGRITLAKSVLNAMPVYQMQVLKLPKYVCKEIDRIVRDFIWGSSILERKLHWIGWEQICKPKENGGLGIRSAEKYNLALLAKLGWRILKEDNSVAWVQVFKNKYFRNGILNRVINGSESSACKAILAGIDASREGIVEVVDEEGPSVTWKLENSGQFTVKSAYYSLGNWGVDSSFRWDLVWKMKCSQKVRVFMWRIALNRLATSENLYRRNVIESMRCCICGAEREDLIHVFLKCKVASIIWNLLGCFAGPQRQQAAVISLPGAGNADAMEELLVAGSVEALQRGLEGLTREESNHIQALNETWTYHRGSSWTEHAAAEQPLELANEPAVLGKSAVQGWLEGHLTCKARVAGLEWPYIFASVLWIIWVKRNNIIFNNMDRIPHKFELKNEIVTMASNFILAWGKRLDGGVIKMASNVLVKWTKPSDGVKLNVDGSFSAKENIAGIGGIMRDRYGSCLAGFTGPCLVDSPIVSETFALLFGLKWAISKGYVEMIIETDSKELHALVKGGGSSTHYERDSGKLHALVKGGGSLGSRHVSVLGECHALLRKYPKFDLQFIYREANFCADKLAKEGARMFNQPVIFTEPPEYLSQLIMRDRSERATARVVLD